MSAQATPRVTMSDPLVISSGARFSIQPTSAGHKTLAPITLVIDAHSCPFRFQDYLTGEEAATLGEALIELASRVPQRSDDPA